MGKGGEVCLGCDPGHNNMAENVEADGLAKQASKGYTAIIRNSPLMKIGVKQKEIWQDLNDCAILPHLGQRQILAGQKAPHLLKKWLTTMEAFCEECEEQEETVDLILFLCLTLENRRALTAGQYSTQRLNQSSDCQLKQS